MIINVNLDTDDFDALNTAASQILGELERRRIIEEAAAEVDRINEQVQDALGRKPGDQWEQPLGAHDAYPLGWTATYLGKTWESLRAGNNFEPGTDSTVWKELVPEGGAPPEWKQPQAHNPYMTGDRVTFQGGVYESLVDNNGWSPEAYPAGWKLIE